MSSTVACTASVGTSSRRLPLECRLGFGFRVLELLERMPKCIYYIDFSMSSANPVKRRPYGGFHLPKTPSALKSLDLRQSWCFGRELLAMAP